MNTRPKLSIIIPTKNEEKLLPHCLKAFQNQITTFPYEVIIVDTHSTDKTCAIARAYGAKVISQPIKGKVFAFRKGASRAKGDILCFTEADCVVPRHWVQTIGVYLDAHPDVSTVCGMYTYRRTTPLSQYLTLFGHYIGHTLHYMFYGHHSIRASNFAVRKSAYEASGGFAKELLELYDTELSQRLKNHGDIHILQKLRIETSDRRIKGRLVAYLGELFPAVWALLTRKPLKGQTYADIR